jgi:hypothetical protein
LSNAGSTAWFGGSNSTGALHVTDDGLVNLSNVTFRRTGGYAAVVRRGGAITCTAVDGGGFGFYRFASGSASQNCP